MPTLSDHMSVFRAALREGSVPLAYRSLLQFLLDLRTRFQKSHPEYDVPGTFYSGYMDMSYFAIVPPALKPRKLKIALVFVYSTFRFEVWLSGVNRAVQEHYYQLIQDSGWSKYRLVPEIKGSDAILVHVLADPPDWSNLDALAALQAAPAPQQSHFGGRPASAGPTSPEVAHTTGLADQLESGTLAFIRDVEAFLAQLPQ